MMDNYGGKLLQPDLDFSKVRDGRRSPLFYYDVDLSIARSIGAGTHLVLPLAGDSFFVDKNPTLVGAATVHFQDTNFGTASAPVYCEPGAILKVPFTQLLIENVAQAGKKFRIHYGVNIDFQPGASSSVSITGEVSTIDTLSSVENHYYASTSIAVGTLVTPIITPGANVNGVFVRAVFQNLYASPTAFVRAALFASAVAPTNFNSSAMRYTISVCVANASATGINSNTYDFGLRRKIPAGWGIWLVESALAATGAGEHFMEYDFA